MRFLWWFLCIFLVVNAVRGQVIAPVQVTPQVLPPYSVYLEDYAQVGIEKLRLIILQRDLSVPNYQIRLKMSLKWNGREIIRTSNNFVPAPILIDAGIPVLVSGTDLAPYLSVNSWEVLNGFNVAQYQATKALPEGSYEMCFTAFDFSRPDVAVSNVGCAFYFLSKSEPPLLNIPACGTTIPLQTPQQILFTWSPLNTGSLNSASETEYIFSLYEIRPKDRNPNDIAQSTPPIFTTTTDFPQYLYGIADPPLLDSMSYAWRVQARDKSGRDAFRNQGYSAVCDFKYGGLRAGFRVGMPANVRGKGVNQRTAEWKWGVPPADTFDLFRVQYKKVGSGFEWFSQTTTDSSFRSFDLEPDKEYELRVQGQKEETWGNYSPLVRVRTPAVLTPKCGEAVVLQASEQGEPLPILQKGMIVQVQGFDMLVTEVSGGNGYFSGKGKIGFGLGLTQFSSQNENTNALTDTLGIKNPFDTLAAKIPYFNVRFSNLFVNVNREASGSGRVEFVSQGVDVLVGNLWQASNDYNIRKRQMDDNRDRFSETDFDPNIITYNFAITNIVLNSDGTLTITDSTQATYINDAIKAILANGGGKSVIIEDKNGDQWVISPDGKVEVVKGGGLPPMDNLNISSLGIEVLKEALKQLKQDYTPEKIVEIENTYKQKNQEFQQYADEMVGSLDINPIRIDSTSQTTDKSTSFLLGADIEPANKILPRHLELASKKDSAQDLLQTYQLISLFNKNINRKKEYALLATAMTHENKNFNQYLEEQEKLGVSRETLIPIAKASLLNLIKTIIKKYKK